MGFIQLGNQVVGSRCGNTAAGHEISWRLRLATWVYIESGRRWRAAVSFSRRIIPLNSGCPEIRRY
ncbi:MAG: hypothetical protein R2911_44055 [Caldilineaceae bacterium]